MVHTESLGSCLLSVLHRLARMGKRGPGTALLICVAPDIARERRMQHVAQNKLASPSGLIVWTTTEVLLNENGPLARIWLRGIPHRTRIAQPNDSLRQSIVEVILGKKGN